MIYSLRGTIVHYDATSLAIECAGVAYYCQTTLTTLSQVAALGNEVLLYTHMSFRQDAVELFAFADLAERNCFRMLIGVSGVGPKAALAILSALSPQELALSIVSGDIIRLTGAQGVGKKLAQRIVLELKDKMSGGDLVPEPAEVASVQQSMEHSNANEAIRALVVLGYSASEAASAVAKLGAELSIEDMIKAALRALTVQ